MFTELYRTLSSIILLSFSLFLVVGHLLQAASWDPEAAPVYAKGSVPAPGFPLSEYIFAMSLIF